MQLLSLPVPGFDRNGNPRPPGPVTIPFTVPVAGTVTVTGPSDVTVRDTTGSVVAGPGTTVTFAGVQGVYLIESGGTTRGTITATVNPSVVTPTLFAPTGGDDGVAIASQLSALADRGGGVLKLTAGLFKVGTPIVWTDGSVQLEGSGSGTILQAVDAISSVLSIEVGGAGRGRFADFTVDGNGLATNPVYQSITSETSVGTIFERIQAKNASSGNYQWVNSGCEDCSYVGIVTPGDESDSKAIPPAMSLSVPDGALSIRGGTIFGEVNIEAQLIDVEGSTIGPFFVNNPNPNSAEQMLSLRGCYIYDGNHPCVDTGTNLCSITASGCVFVSQNNPQFANGNIPTDGNINLVGNTFVYTPGTSGTEVYAVQASGAGWLTLCGSTPIMGSATWNHFNGVGSPTTVVTNLAGP